MNIKQTDNDQQKRTVPEDWSPVSSAGGKTKPAEPTNENVGAEFQKMLASSIDTENSIESNDGNNATNSLQTESTVEIHSTSKRISNKQRKESLDEYRQTFLSVPKLEDRKPVFISREVRDSLDEIARKLGGRRMSVSGFIENLARHHLEIYQDNVELWKKL